MFYHHVQHTLKITYSSNLSTLLGVIGFPFYGRSFIGATGLYQPHEGVDDATWHADEGVPQYYNIYSLLSTMIDERDEQTMTQIAYFHTGNMVSYDDERAICDKTEYAMDNGHLGYIIWELR